MGGLAQRIADWQQRAGRHHLPWQGTRDPYRIWLSEIMLQQTQAATVVPYYLRFIERFPDVASLAAAPPDEVMQAWSGLGYYARARNLHRCAQTICAQHDGQFPRDVDALASLPGIGRSTAAAIAAFAWGARHPILDGNVRRVLARYAGIAGDPGTAAVSRRLWSAAQEALDAAPPGLDMRAYTQGQMDLGATVCTRHRPACGQCPLAEGCEARRSGRQHELPGRRAPRARPERQCHWLILESGGRILLQRRPPRGIWGGLWSPPQFDALEALHEAVRSQHGPAAAPALQLAAFQHEFTHFRLHVTPWLLRCAGSPAVPDRDHAWLTPDEAGRRGLPAPVSRLLSALQPPGPAGGEGGLG